MWVTLNAGAFNKNFWVAGRPRLQQAIPAGSLRQSTRHARTASRHTGPLASTTDRSEHARPAGNQRRGGDVADAAKVMGTAMPHGDYGVPQMADDGIPNVVIAGGGPAGLLCALLLSRRCIRTTVVEESLQTEQWSPRSYSLVLNPRGTAALTAAGVLESVQAVAAEDRVFTVHSADGSQTVIPRDQPHFRITRPLLVECLLTAVNELPLVEVRRGAAVTGYTQNADGQHLLVGLGDGTHLGASHLVGADGKWSAVRAALGGTIGASRLRTEPSWGVSMKLPSWPAQWQADGIHLFKTSTNQPFYALAAPLPDGSCHVTLVCFDELFDVMPALATTLCPDESTDQWSAGLPRKGSNTEDALASLLNAELPQFLAAVGLESLASAQVNRRVSWLDSGLDSDFCDANGRVTLIGDAAHSMTPSLGEGCNCAFESAAALASALSSATPPAEEPSQRDVTEAFFQYGRSRPPQVRPVQERSAANSRFVRSSARNE